MKKILFAFFLALLQVCAFAQTPFTAPWGFNYSAPTGAPSALGTRVRFDITTGRIYTWSPDALNWQLQGYTIDQISGTSAPAYAPVRGQSWFAVNGDTLPRLYQYTGSGTVWKCLNCSDGKTYTAGTGITLSGPNLTVINNAGDLSNTNELNTGFDISGGNLRIIDAGATRTVAVTSIAPDQSVTNEIQTIDTFLVSGSNLLLSLTQDNQPAKTITLPASGITALTGDVTATGPGSAVATIATASASVRGLLSSADWNTFNGKIGGGGTLNYLPKFTGASALGNSLLFDNGTQVGFNTNSPEATFHVKKSDVSGSATGGSFGFLIEDGITNAVFGIQTDASRYGEIVFGDQGGLARGGLRYSLTSRSTNRRQLQFFTNGFGASSMVIDSTSKVGVNNSAPESQLHVTQTDVLGTFPTGYAFGVEHNSDDVVLAMKTNSIRSNRIWFGDNTNNNLGGIFYYGSTHGSLPNHMQFWTNGAQRTWLDETGRFGIGVDPSARLHVVGAGATSSTWTAQFHNSTGTNNALMVRDDSRIGFGTSVLDENFNFSFAQNGSTNIRIVNANTGSAARTAFLSGAAGASAGFFACPSTYTAVPEFTSRGVFSTDGALSNGVLLRASTGNIEFMTSLTVRAMFTNSGSLLIGTTTDAASAALNVTSTTKGFLPPRMTADQASAIASPAEGLMVYVTTTSATFPTKGWYGWNGATWEKLNN